MEISQSAIQCGVKCNWEITDGKITSFTIADYIDVDELTYFFKSSYFRYMMCPLGHFQTIGALVLILSPSLLTSNWEIISDSNSHLSHFINYSFHVYPDISRLKIDWIRITLLFLQDMFYCIEYFTRFYAYNVKYLSSFNNPWMILS